MSSAIKALVLAIAPSLAWKVARALQLAGYRPVLAGPSWFGSLNWLPSCERYVPLDGLRPAGHNRVHHDVMDQVKMTCLREGVGVVVPADMASTLLLSEQRHRLGSTAVFPLASSSLLTTLHDKWTFSQLLSSLGIDQPHTELLRSPGDVAGVADYPVLTKALDLSNGEGIELHRSRASLETWLRDSPRALPVLAQQFIRGRDVGITLYADRGRLIACSSFFHTERWSRTFFEDAQLTATVQRLIAATGYDGVGHIDAVHDEDAGRFAFLEFNPRFAGSLLYSVKAGYNYAAMGMQQALGARSVPLSTAPTGRVTLPWRDRIVGGAVTVHGRYRALRHGRVPGVVAGSSAATGRSVDEAA